MNGGPLVDRLLAVTAMLLSVRPLLRGALGSRSHLSWKRALVLGVGAAGALVALVGLLALRSRVLGEPFYLPSWSGGALAAFGGMLGLATVMSGRGPNGMSEDDAIRHATLAIAMVLYVAAPRPALVLLGVTRVLRAALPFTTSRRRGWRLVEGLVLTALCLVPRDETLGGLKLAAGALGLG